VSGITLVALVRNEAEVLGRCLASVRGLIDGYCIVDTGSTDETRKVIADNLHGWVGEVHERPWRSCGENLTEALSLAPKTGWLLWLHADQTVEWHEDLKEWLAEDPDPETDAWMVSVLEHGTHYRLPLLVRAGLDWRYVGVTHEYLDPAGRKHRPLLGLTVTHHTDGSNREGKHERDIELLASGVMAGDARAVFYSAQAHQCLGNTQEAISLYELRARMGGFEEEAWYAGFQAAALREDEEALIAAWRARPWRPEPLRRLAEIVSRREHGDVLFSEVG
jgi:Glycosyl transferase family 2